MATQWSGLGRVEQFVQAIVAGGIVLVAGLWSTEVFAWGSLPWLVGVALGLVGVAGISWGIFTELSV